MPRAINFEHAELPKVTIVYQFLAIFYSLRSDSINNKKIDNELEFLDVLHVTTLNTKNGFITKNFINECLLNSTSHHPTSVYKSLAFIKAVQLRRLIP